MQIVPQWWKKHFLAAEFVLAVLAGFAFFWWAQWHGGWPTIDRTLDGNRAAVYGALASIFGSLLGFVITAASIVLGFSTSDRLSIVRSSTHYPTLWKIFTASIRALALATIIALIALVYDRDKAACHLVLYLAVYATILAVFRLARCIWVMEQIISLVSKQPVTTSPSQSTTK